MAISTLTTKGQLTIPKSVRERLSWQSGDRLDVSVDDRGRMIVDIAAGDFRRLRGLLHRPGQEPLSVEAMNEAIGRHHAEGFEGSRSRR